MCYVYVTGGNLMDKTDILIAGGGAAGIMAALEVARVLLLLKKCLFLARKYWRLAMANVIILIITSQGNVTGAAAGQEVCLPWMH